MASNHNTWVAEINSLLRDGVQLVDLDLELLSPQFTYDRWRICPEHQRSFSTVVLKWLGPPSALPSPPAGASQCPRSDHKKGWNYRAKLAPGDLRRFLDQLNPLSAATSMTQSPFPEYAEYMAYISSDETKAAFRYLVEDAPAVLQCRITPRPHGNVERTVHYDVNGSEPYGFIVSHQWLRFYLRKPWDTHGSITPGQLVSQLKKEFPIKKEFPNSEVKLNKDRSISFLVVTVDDAHRAIRLAKNQMDLATPFASSKRSADRTVTSSERLLNKASKAIENEGLFDSETNEDKRVFRPIAQRLGQPRFRKRLIAAYDGRCAVTGCDETSVLEAAHIVPHSETPSYRVTHGLLLRADIHTLFDLDLLGIDPDSLKVAVSHRVCGKSYENLNGRALRLPKNSAKRPDQNALRQRWDQFMAANGT